LSHGRQIVEIKGNNYCFEYDSASATLKVGGVVRMNGEEYEPFKHMLEAMLDDSPALLTVDVQELQMLNSSGITLLAKFILTLHKKKTTAMRLRGCARFGWQQRSFGNFRKLMPGLQIEWVD
jgi:hypothetical protein